MCLHLIKRVALTQLAAAVIVAPALAASSGLSLAINDVSTHQAVQALIKGDGPELFSAYTDQAGRLNRDLRPGKYNLDVSSQGYKSSKTSVTIETGKTTPLIIMLDPLNPSEEDQQLPSQLRPGFTLLHGYAMDDQGQPLQDVRVGLQRANVHTFTNQRGYYWLSVPTPPRAAAEIPATDTLTADKPGYFTVIYHNIAVAGLDGGGVFLSMKRGSGVEEHDSTHKQMRQEVEPQSPRPSPVKKKPGDGNDRLAMGGAALIPKPASLDGRVTPEAVQVPATITVGLSCTNPSKISTCSTCSWSTCNTAVSYSLEQYVQTGLGQEWLPNWDPNSLQAGAVAYRTYGAYYTVFLNGHTNLYDICSNAACQVFDPNYRPGNAVKNAQAATAGVILTADGVDPFFAEYAAESNQASDTTYATCPNGQTGEPANGWPCMKDFLCTGASQANTHARGMCQWGSQRWATGKNASGVVVTAPRDWRCILDHYYNANSNSILVDPTGTGNPGAGSGQRTAFLQGHPTYGRVAYVDTLDNNIRALNAADGTGDTLIAASTWSPAWSLGGTQLAFTFFANPTLNSTSSLGLINSDGTGRIQLTTGSGGFIDAFGDTAAAWSPLGDKIAYWSTAAGSSTDIWTVNPDGSHPVRLTSGLMSDNALAIAGGDMSHIAWSPDGTKIAFSASADGGQSLQVFSMNADGSNLTQLTNCQSSSPGSSMTGFCADPSWSPDGKQIAYLNDGSYSGVAGIYLMNPDGTNVIRLTSVSQGHHWYPSWSTDGQQIIFEAGVPQTWVMYSMKRDGTSWVQISPAGTKWEFNGYATCSRCRRFDQ